MSTEELLRPRYKVIAIDTTESFQIGDILNHPPEWPDYIGVTPTGKLIFYPEKYPHLFKKLEWYEERKIEEMPEYVKVIREECVKDTGLYCKVYKWSVFDDKLPIVSGQYGAELEGYTPSYLARTELNFPGQVYGRLNVAHLFPATATEHQQYINQKERQ